MTLHTNHASQTVGTTTLHICTLACQARVTLFLLPYGSALSLQASALSADRLSFREGSTQAQTKAEEVSSLVGQEAPPGTAYPVLGTSSVLAFQAG